MTSTFQYLCRYYLLSLVSDMDCPLEMADNRRSGPPGEQENVMYVLVGNVSVKVNF